MVISVLVLVELTLIKVLMSNRGPSPSWLMAPCKFVSSGVFGRVLLTEDPQVGVQMQQYCYKLKVNTKPAQKSLM